MEFDPLRTIIFTLFLVASLSLFFYRLYKRFQFMTIAKGESPPIFDKLFARLSSIAIYILGQVRLLKRKIGIMHFTIFWGFLILLPTLAQATLDGFGINFLIPIFSDYGPMLLLQDIAAILVLIAVFFGLLLRLVVKPDRYKGSHTFEGVLVLVLISLIMLGLLLMNGFRGLIGEDPFASWRPIAAVIVSPFASLDTELLVSLAEAFWWLHILVALIFLPLLPIGKHFHIITVLPNVFFRKMDPVGKLTPATMIEEDIVGLSKIEHLSWKRMLDLYSCVQCGKCQDVCPAYMARGVLSPKLVIMKLREHLEEKASALLSKPSTKPSTVVAGLTGSSTFKTVLSQELVGDVITKDELWDCMACFACSNECPLFIEHVEMIIDMRRYLAYEGDMGTQLQDVLENISRYGNSFGQSERMRAKWTTDLDFKIKDVRKEEAEYLWFVGDFASYDPVSQTTSKLTAKVLHYLGIDFGLLYEGEKNSGNDVRRIGEEGLFEELLEGNINAMKKSKFSKIITTDPHSYNTLKNEYPDYNFDRPVFHIVEILDDLIHNKKLSIKKKLSYIVTYQDPCYLGRYNNVYNAPRRLLKNLGCTLVELPRSKGNAFCCEAGGGRIWKDEQHDIIERPAENRIKEALTLNEVKFFVVACPKDMSMFRDAIKTTGTDNKLIVKDIIELVAECLELKI